VTSRPRSVTVDAAHAADAHADAGTLPLLAAQPASAPAASPPRPLPNTHAVHVPNLVRLRRRTPPRPATSLISRARSGSGSGAMPHVRANCRCAPHWLPEKRTVVRVTRTPPPPPPSPRRPVPDAAVVASVLQGRKDGARATQQVGAARLQPLSE
jgi:hypothetical protein